MLVSGYIDLNKGCVRPGAKSHARYLEHAVPLLELPVHKVIFLEPDTLNELRAYANDTTHFVPFTKEQLHWWTRRNEILRTKLPETRNQEKDTHDFMIVQLQKTFWLKQAMDLYPKVEQFVWIDFGINHMLNDHTRFKHSCLALVKKSYSKVRIGGIHELSLRHVDMSSIMWYFCGGVLGGHRDALLRLNRLVTNKATELLSQGLWTWEVCVYYLVYLDHPDLFDWYQANFNMTMLDGY